MKKLFQQKIIVFSIILIVFLFSILVNQPVKAEFPKVESNLGPGVEVDDDLFLQGTEVIVAGHVKGMLFAIGEKIIIQSGAQIDNDLYLAGKSVLIEEDVKIAGNLFVAGQNVVVNTPVDRNLAVAAATLDLNPTADIGRNLFFTGFHFSHANNSVIQDNLYAACYQASINGTVEKNLRVSVVAIQLNGTVNRNAEIAIDASGDDEGIRIWLPYMQQLNIPDLLPPGLNVSEKTRIEGQLIYTSAKSLEQNLNNLPLGGVVENIREQDSNQRKNEQKIVMKNPFVLRFFRFIRQLVGFLFFALISWRFGKRFIIEATQIAISKPVNSLGVGIVSTLVVYLGTLIFFILILFLTVILGILTLNQLSSTMFFLGLAAIILILTSFGILLTFISKFILAFWFGGWVLNKFKSIKENKDIWRLITGIILFLILSAIPIFGWIFGVIISLIGIGAIWYTLQQHDQAGILPDFE